MHKILQSRYPTDFPLTESDIETLYFQLLVQADYENHNEWREWARALGGDEKGRRMETLIADWHCRTAERSSRKRSPSVDPPSEGRRETRYWSYVDELDW